MVNKYNHPSTLMYASVRMFIYMRMYVYIHPRIQANLTKITYTAVNMRNKMRMHKYISNFFFVQMFKMHKWVAA
jgi:hypothetical protein